MAAAGGGWTPRSSRLDLSRCGVDDVFEAILSELDRNLPVDISAIWLLEDDELYLAACHNCDESFLEQALYDSLGFYQRLMEVLYSNPRIRKPTDPIWITGLVAGYEQDYSALAVPLRVGDQPYGVITLAHSTPGRYGHEAKAMTTTFASYAAVAIENARCMIRRRNRRMPPPRCCRWRRRWSA